MCIGVFVLCMFKCCVQVFVWIAFFMLFIMCCAFFSFMCEIVFLRYIMCLIYVKEVIVLFGVYVAFKKNIL